MKARCGRCKAKVEGGIEALRSHWRNYHPLAWRGVREWLGEAEERLEIEEEALERLDHGDDAA